MISTCSMWRIESSSHSNPTLLSCCKVQCRQRPTQSSQTSTALVDRIQGTWASSPSGFYAAGMSTLSGSSSFNLSDYVQIDSQQSSQLNTSGTQSTARLGCSTAVNSNSKCRWWWHCCRTYCESWWPHGGGIWVKKENCWRSWGGKLLLKIIILIWICFSNTYYITVL